MSVLITSLRAVSDSGLSVALSKSKNISSTGIGLPIEDSIKSTQYVAVVEW